MKISQIELDGTKSSTKGKQEASSQCEVTIRQRSLGIQLSRPGVQLEAQWVDSLNLWFSRSLTQNPNIPKIWLTQDVIYHAQSSFSEKMRVQKSHKMTKIG